MLSLCHIPLDPCIKMYINSWTSALPPSRTSKLSRDMCSGRIQASEAQPRSWSAFINWSAPLRAVQHVDTGELLMQAFADRAAVSETLQTGLATFYSRSRKVRRRPPAKAASFGNCDATTCFNVLK